MKNNKLNLFSVVYKYSEKHNYTRLLAVKGYDEFDAKNRFHFAYGEDLIIVSITESSKCFSDGTIK